MNVRRTLLITLVSILAIPIVLFIAALAYRWSRTLTFKGDGKMAFLGPTRPSYQLKMQAIPLDRPGDYRYSFVGLPSESNMSFLLYVPGRSTGNREEVEQLRTSIEVRITNSSGESICHASGTPGGAPFAPGNVNWILESGPDEGAFWHDYCVHFPTDRRQHYTLVIRITDIDPNAVNMVLIPTVAEGGIELP